MNDVYSIGTIICLLFNALDLMTIFTVYRIFGINLFCGKMYVLQRNFHSLNNPVTMYIVKLKISIIGDFSLYIGRYNITMYINMLPTNY